MIVELIAKCKPGTAFLTIHRRKRKVFYFEDARLLTWTLKKGKRVIIVTLKTGSKRILNGDNTRLTTKEGAVKEWLEKGTFNDKTSRKCAYFD